MPCRPCDGLSPSPCPLPPPPCNPTACLGAFPHIHVSPDFPLPTGPHLIPRLSSARSSALLVWPPCGFRSGMPPLLPLPAAYLPRRAWATQQTALGKDVSGFEPESSLLEGALTSRPNINGLVLCVRERAASAWGPERLPPPTSQAKGEGCGAAQRSTHADHLPPGAHGRHAGWLLRAARPGHLAAEPAHTCTSGTPSAASWRSSRQ